MKTSKVTKIVRVECWSCTIDKHKHRSKEAAENCIKLKSQKTAAEMVRWTNSELANVCEAILRGETYKYVGKRYGISASRLAQVYAKGIRRMRAMVKLDNQDTDKLFGTVSDFQDNHEFWLPLITKLREAHNP